MHDISFVVPSYNRAAQTKAAVESILAQDVRAQIIVVDDASDDGAALEQMFAGDSHIRLVRRQKNGGAAAARNTGLEHVTAPIISFLDSDDCLLPGTLGTRMAMAMSAGMGDRTSATVYACGWQETGRSSRKRYPRPSRSRSDFFSACWFAPGSAILAPASLFHREQEHFDARLRRLEDFDFFARKAIDGLMLATQPVLGVQINTSYTALGNDVFKAADLIEDKMAAYRAENRITRREQAAVKAYLAYERAAAYSWAGKKTQATVSLLKSLAYKPRTTLFPGPGWDDAPSL